jgi:adenylyltransferase/sulfurtransferase
MPHNREIALPIMNTPESPLSTIELAHYSRHLTLPGFGMEKQLALKNAKVLLIGAGGLGCPIGLYLAAAGVGTIGVVDFDCVERSNLQRQIAHTVEDIGQPKVDSLIAAMRAMNPLLTYQAHPYRLSSDNVAETIAGYDLVLDGSDNFATRFLLADACYLQGVALLQGAVYEYEAQLCLFTPNAGPCYRCMFQEPPSKNALAPCAEVGILGVVPGTAGLIMATEAIKFITGIGSSIQGKLLLYNALNQTMRQWFIERDKECPLCGDNPTITEINDLVVQCPTVESAVSAEVTSEQAQVLIQNGIVVLDVRESFEFASGHLPNALHIPLGQVQTQAENLFADKAEPILAYCQKGQRSLEAARILTELGYTQVYSLAGGLSVWSGAVVVPV